MWIEPMHLVIGDDDDDFVLFCVDYPAVDAYDTRKTIQQKFRHMVPPYTFEDHDPEHFAAWLQHTLFEIEEHESREFLRRDGAIYDDPHSDSHRP
jgi:hypothetical protein